MGAFVSIQELQSLFGSAENLPQMPNSPLQLSELLDNTDASAQEIENAIHADPALTVSILRAASSAVFGRSKPVTSVKEAVMVLGQQSIRSLAVAMWTNALISRSRHNTKFNPKQFAKNGAFVGAMASQAAFVLKIQGEDKSWTKDEIFAAGVMHLLPVGLLSLLSPDTFNHIYEYAMRKQSSIQDQFQETYNKSLGEVAQPALSNLVIPEKFFPVILNDPNGSCPTINVLIQFSDSISFKHNAGFLPWSHKEGNTELTLIENVCNSPELLKMTDSAREMADFLCAA